MVTGAAPRERFAGRAVVTLYCGHFVTSCCGAVVQLCGRVVVLAQFIFLNFGRGGLPVSSWIEYNH